MPTIATSDGVKISYRVVGSGPRTVLAIHGWMVSSSVWDELAGLLDLEGLRLVIPDLRGTGGSDKPAGGYTIERYAQDALALMDELGDRSLVVLGHSMGGTIAQWIAAAAPERVAGLVLLCPVPASGAALPPEAVALFRGASTDEPKTAILGMACKDLPEAARSRLLSTGASIPAACIAEAFDAWSGASFAERLGAVTARTLIVASEDPFLPPAFLREAIAAKIAGARVAMVHGAGHYVQVERPRETAAVIEGFLAGLGPF